MALLCPEWCTHTKTGPGFAKWPWWQGRERRWSLPFFLFHVVSHSGLAEKVTWDKVSTAWRATAEGLKCALGHEFQKGRAGSTTFGYSSPGVHTSRTRTRTLVLAGPSEWVWRLAGQSPECHLNPSIPHLDLPAPWCQLVWSSKISRPWREVLASTHPVFQNPCWIKKQSPSPKWYVLNTVDPQETAHLPAALSPSRNCCILAKAPKPNDKTLRRKSPCVGQAEAWRVSLLWAGSVADSATHGGRFYA